MQRPEEMSDLTYKKRCKRNSLLVQIKEKGGFIRQNNEAIERIRRSQLGGEYILAQVTKRNEINDGIRTEVVLLEQEITEINLGIHDEELICDSKRVTDEFNQTQKKKKIIRKEKKVVASKKQSQSKEYMKGIIQASRGERRKKRDWKYGWKEYCKANNMLPNYIAKNLREMPNNKGYLWRGCYFFGALPEQRSRRGEYVNTIIFEKRKGVLTIHEWGEKYKSIYKKEGKARKTLFSREFRTQKT
jgi:hypothetical protein